MSRFFAGVSDSESESQSEDEQIVNRPAANLFSYSDDEDESKRVVRSAKEKRYEELSNVIKNIRNYRKIKDMSSIQTSFEELSRVFTKSQPVIMKEENGVIPRFIIRAFVELQDFINESWDDLDARKNLSKNNKKSLEILRQKYRKFIKDYEEEVAKFREAPFDDDEEEEEKKVEEEESSSDEDEVPASKADAFKKAPVEKKPAKPAPGDDSEDSEDWGSSDDSDDDSSDDGGNYANYRDGFLKKPGADGEEKVKKPRGDPRKKKPDGTAVRRGKKESDDEGEWEVVTKGTTTAEKPKMFTKDEEINVPVVLNKVNEIVAARGKKRTDRRQQIELLYELKTIAEQHNLGQAIIVKICFNIVSAIFDYNPRVTEPMKPELWTQLLTVLQELMTLLLAAKNIRMCEAVMDDMEEFETAPFSVRGCALTAAERMDDEFTKLLKDCDPHSNDYMERLRDEVAVSKIIDHVLNYEEFLEDTPTNLCRIYLRKIDHLYYKYDPAIASRRRGELPADTKTTMEEMERLCRFIYSNDDTDRLRTRAILCQISHHALHDNWFRARDLLLMSHLQENIEHADPSTQILFNRTMANLGLCAFRQGNIKEAHLCLVDLMMTGKPKELLAQGLLPQRQHERSAEQEKVEKQRQMPFHMHINLELLECVYLVSAMIHEIPYMAAHEFDARRRMISKTFYQQLRSSERQALVGPPESMREHVVAAAKAMRCGNWSACANFIVNKRMNAKVWDLFHDPDSVREMITRFIKENSLSTYLFTYSNVYSSISIPQLAVMFDLTKEKVHSLISKMIISEELMASLDDPTETVVLHRSEPSRLQTLSMQLADKVTCLTDANVKIFEMKQGNFMHRGNQVGGQRNKGQGRGERNNYRNQDGQNRNWTNNRRDNRNWKNRNNQGADEE